MFTPYRSVLQAPGALRFCLSAFVMRLPLSMYPVSLVLLISLRDGDYAFGGYLTGAYIAGAAVGGPVLSRSADRRGQRPVLALWTSIHTAAVAGLIAAVLTDQPRWVLLAVAVVIGFSYLSVGALVRARWAGVFGGRREQLTTAFSLESTLDEVIFVSGPIVASVVATQLDPLASFVLIAVLAGAGAVGLGLAPGGEAVVTHGDAPRPPIPTGPILLVVATLAFVGMTLGGVDVATIAYVGQAGYDSWSGAVLACFAFGSGVAGLLYGAVRWRRPVETRLRDQAFVFGVMPVLLYLVPDVGVLAPLLFLVGLATAPMLIASFGTAERITPPERLTESMAWVNTGLNVGAGVIAPVIGLVADHVGADVALRIPWPAAALGALAGLATFAAVRRHLRDRARQPGPDTAAWDDGNRAALP
ncbi:MFS transporter [Jatrophihabitans sp. YIM 134969]